MKKSTALLLSLVMVFALASCGNNGNPEAAPQNPDEDAPVLSGDTAHPDTTAPLLLNGDSYWVAYESEGDNRGYVPEGDDVLTDLTLWADGTARIREIEDGLRLASAPVEQNLTWICENDGTLNLYSAYSGDTPYWTGKRTKDGIELNRFGGVYRFREEAMPEGGALYAPAELMGVWLQTGSEVEGCIDETLPDRLVSLVFCTDWEGDGKSLLASSETGDYSGFTSGNQYYDRALTLLDEPIYEGCGNDVWSVRIGEESPLNQHGYPSGTDYYVTLLDQNTLLLQQYYSFDNGEIPGVSYQTFKRFLTEAPYELEASLLNGGDYQLVGYIDENGVRHEKHPDYSDFRLHLNPNSSYRFVATPHEAEEISGGGSYWAFGAGGTLLLRSDDDEACFAGAASYYDGMIDVPEIFLWDNAGGILCLKGVATDEWDGYVDTMTDMEGIAFSAPENTLFVLYNQNYTDMTELAAFPYYEIDDGPDAQYVLVSSVIDDSYFWLAEDGFCREDFGTVHAGESFVIKVNVPENGGYLLQIECSMGDYCFELNRSIQEFNQNWNYITT